MNSSNVKSMFVSARYKILYFAVDLFIFSVNMCTLKPRVVNKRY